MYSIIKVYNLGEHEVTFLKSSLEIALTPKMPYEVKLIALIILIHDLPNDYFMCMLLKNT